VIIVLETHWSISRADDDASVIQKARGSFSGRDAQPAAGAFVGSRNKTSFLVNRKEFDCFSCHCEKLERHGLFGPKLKLAVFVFFGSGRHLAARDAANVFENTRADFVDGLSSVDDAAGR